VVAYALAGSVNIDLINEALGTDPQGNPVYLGDVWPTDREVQDVIARALNPAMFEEKYSDVFRSNETWNAIQAGESVLYQWDETSTYIQETPFFQNLSPEVASIQNIHNARVLAFLGDSITTDHISPAGAIPAEGPAGRFLVSKGVPVRDFNSFGSRRGNDRVMIRGAFSNIRLKNHLVPGVEGGVTIHLPDGESMSIYEASLKYKAEGVPLVILAGKEYGTGSSRDWAAKGANLLGVKAVIAESYERIHRSNLVGMGVLPLQYQPGENAESLGLTGQELYSIDGLTDDIRPHSRVTVRAARPDGSRVAFTAVARLDTPVEVEYYRNGGVLNTVLRNML
jgi:aconitate hydratase